MKDVILKDNPIVSFMHGFKLLLNAVIADFYKLFD